MSILSLLSFLRNTELQFYKSYILPLVKIKRRYSYERTFYNIGILLTMAENKCILSVQEVAQFFHHHNSWVYKHQKKLGGRKLGGSLIFPAEEDLYERIFCTKERVEVRLHNEGNQVHERLVQNKGRGKKSRSRKEEGNNKSEGSISAPNRHGLLGIGK